MRAIKKMNAIKYGIFFVGIAAFLDGCSSSKTNTLGSLKYVPEKEENIEIKNLNHQEVRAEYKEIIDLFEDKQVKEQIERRIADVYMMEGVYDENKSKQKQSYYVDAIKAYRNILEKYPNSPDNAEVLYQLAKAYDMEGNQDEALKMLSALTERHPAYANIAEAHFRAGDIYFNKSAYAKAEQSYLAVTQLDKSKLAINAHYMLGWAYYKQAQYNNSLNAYAFVLDQLLANQASLEVLGKAEKPLAKDTLHSATLALDRMGGAEAIATFPSIANKNYVWMIYESIGEYYLEKELYEDSANAFRLFVNNYKNSSNAPLLHGKLIEAYNKGGFPRQVLTEKEAYVNAYGMRSSYEGNRGGMSADVSKSIKVYLDELARHYYGLGQATQNEIADVNDVKNKDKVATNSVLAIASFEKAAGFYQQYVETFPNDERIDEVFFLKAEALFLAQRYTDAVLDYERVAYQPKGKSAEKYAANSGYAAIISYQKHIATLTVESQEIKKWQAKAVESMLMFAKKFDTDTRAPTVLTNAADYLFGLNQYKRALEVSGNLIANNPQLDKTLKKTAYGIMAHSYFKLGDYQNAETSYLNQRELVDKSTEEYKQVSERLATSIYKKTEAIVEKGEKESAIEQLLKIKTLTPDSSVRVAAQFDAATMLLDLKQWGRAIVELKELIALFPKHELTVMFPRKLAFAYEKNENWDLAAVSYLGLNKSDPDAEVRREGLFIAATMFEKIKNYTAAIEHFKSYDASYAKPFSTQMEARYHLVLIYEKLSDITNQLSWQKGLIDGDQNAGDQRTDRSRWLAAWANIKNGDYYADQFAANKLYLPLVKSLPAKNKVLENSIKQYQLAADYGILEFVTMSSYKIARLYQQFSKELRESQKPVNLSPDDQKMYAEIIEEQAAPFDKLAIELHQANIDRAWQGNFNEWIDKSFIEMKLLNPARYNKTEIIVSYGDEIR
ncbi:MAG: tetratricopeptide repeat protein [Pseudomonadota bacterium]